MREFVGTLPLVQLREQASRCMECGVPFCHNGCPLGNLIPDWNDLVYRDRWAEASEQLHRTNNFPEFTGRLCPAPCESACVLEINEGDAVSIKQIELAIVNRAWDEGWIVPQPAAVSTGRRVAVVGSGPAGLACAQQLARAGEQVVVFERDEAAGGLVRFGVPEFKIEKRLVERRVEQLVAEGVEFRFGVDVGVDLDVEELRSELRRGRARDGRPRAARPAGARVASSRGVHFAMEYLAERARVIAGTATATISAAGRHVVVIGGGDTGADCVGHAHREGAASVTQIELLGEPPAVALRRADAVAALADEAAHLVRAEGGRRARASRSRRRASKGAAGGSSGSSGRENTGVPPFELVPGTEESRPGRARAARDGLPRPRGARCSISSASSATRAATSRRAVRELAARRVRGRRRAPRAVADRLGDRRGPALRAGGRRLARRARCAACRGSFPFDSYEPRSGVDCRA